MLGRALIRVAAAGLPIARYRRDLRRDQERVAKFEPSLIETPFGRVEYAQAGDGPPVMVVRGVFGGFDFGVGAARVNVPAGYRIISPSRFGFFGSPLLWESRWGTPRARRIAVALVALAFIVFCHR